ncbi:MAG: hypothetical protein AMS14_05860 [Planctomycetes bacterium DG_20]|nr:MAG: hypothetical protein AMS14_05860 [Planctomycetes bacterium DG_20]
MRHRSPAEGPLSKAARRALAGAVLVFVVSALGCRGSQNTGKSEPRPPVPEIAQGTVGAYGIFTSMRTTPVTGYGLVIGLKGTGSADMPANLRRRLLREMYKGGLDENEAAQILESPDTAAVLVRGTVMPYHTRASRFDVEVVALPGTQTKSLEGGTLVKTRLAPVVWDAWRRPALGAAVAVAHGPVVVGATALDDQQAERVDPRQGLVIGGARFGGDRKLTMELVEPNLRMCLLLEQAINGRFPRCAQAHSQQLLSREALEPNPDAPGPEPGLAVQPPPRETRYYLTLTVPPAYAGRWMHFAQVAASLYLDNRPPLVQRRVQYLIDTLRDTPEQRVVACYGLEALGRPSLEPLTALLEDGDGAVRFHAAMVLIALKEARGTPVLIEAARNPDSPHRMAAIGALSGSDDPEAIRTLEDLTASADLSVRLAAYESLRAMPDQTVVEHIEQIEFRGQRYEIHRFGVDLVHSKGPPLIVANATNDPRLILFGDDMQFKPPIFFDEGRYWAVAEEDATAITVKPPKPEPRRPLLASEIEIPFQVLYYVVVMDQLGASYPEVVKRLREADGLGRMTGRFVVRQPPADPAAERRWD